MRLPLLRVDAFTRNPSGGNPAAVCILSFWLDDELLRKVATENNLSATAFLVPSGERWQLRWFTPACEIRLCGHATLAAGFIVMKLLGSGLDLVQFETRFSGIVPVAMEEDLVSMTFPGLELKPCPDAMEKLVASLRLKFSPTQILEGDDIYVVVCDDAQAIAGLDPDFLLLEQLHPYVVCATAPAKDADFVSRYFAPSYGVREDPVTGSVHRGLAPYWAKRLGKSSLHARQLSSRGGELWCDVSGENVVVKGQAVLTMQGWLEI